MLSIQKHQTDKVIILRVVNGTISKKKKIRYNKDGTIDKRHSNSIAGKFVTLYFNQVVKKAITDYIEQYPIEDMNGFVFKSREGSGAISERSVWRIIVNASAEAGIEHNVGTHSLRKTFGYHIWHNAEDKEKALVMLKVIFNHSSVAITKRYIGIMNEEIESVFNDLNLGIDLI